MTSPTSVLRGVCESINKRPSSCCKKNMKSYLVSNDIDIKIYLNDSMSDIT